MKMLYAINKFGIQVDIIMYDNRKVLEEKSQKTD